MTRPGKLRQLLEQAVLAARANISQHGQHGQHGLPMSPPPLPTTQQYSVFLWMPSSAIDVSHEALLLASEHQDLVAISER
jgi:hypothetical protein